jgi:peptidyl-tRNA hydrolase
MKTKMYILVREFVPSGKVPVATAHASLACYLKFKDHPDMVEWLSSSFAKVVCTVTDAEFEKAKEEKDSLVITESTLDGQEVAVVFVPRKVYPKGFGFFRLYK